jgi:hypothetical protein
MNETKKSCEEVERQEVVSPDGEQNEENERQSPHVSRWNSFVNSFVSWMRVYGELISEIVLMLCVAGVCYSMVCLVEIISLFS